MTVILDNKTLTFSNILIFYERRLKRLLPAYLLTVFLTLLVSGFFLISTDYDFLKIDTLWSMFFGTNFQSMFQKQSYFLLVSDYKFLLHTWSLSLEIQYYFIVPFILIPLSTKTKVLPLLIGITISSWVFQTFIPYPTISFGLVLSRIWQFLIGSIVFYHQKQQDEGLKLPEEVNLVTSDNPDDSQVTVALTEKIYYHQSILRAFNFGFIFLLCFMPVLSSHYLYTAVIRIIATGLGGLAIYFGFQVSSYQDTSLITWIGTYIGDISYSVYLLHWPIIILAKYTDVFDSIPLWQITSFIVVVAMVQYHGYEKLLLHQSTKVVASICGVLYLGLFILMLLSQTFGYTRLEHPAVAGNQEIAKKCEELLECNWDPLLMEVAKTKPITSTAAYFCSFEGTGNLTMYLTGNSFALRQLPGVKKGLSKFYKKLYYVARPVCLPFKKLNQNYAANHFCNELSDHTEEFLEKVRPDVMIITEKVSVNPNFRKHIYSIQEALNDTTTQTIAEAFQAWSKYTKKIIHIEPHPSLPFNPAIVLAKEIAQGRDISHRYISQEKVAQEVDPGWLRIKAAMLSCPKCISIDTRQAYLDENGRYYLYDKKTKLSMFCDQSHFSLPAAEKLAPILEKAVSQLLKDL